MIQQESQTVWGYGRGMVRTVARVTYRGDPGDEADPAQYTTLGAMKFTRTDVGEYTVLLDVAGPTEIRYCCARILHGADDDLQAQCVVDETILPVGSALAVQVWKVNGAPADVVADLDTDSALCIEVIVDQTGEMQYAYGAQIPPPPVPVPAPMPPAPPGDDRPAPRVP